MAKRWICLLAVILLLPAAAAAGTVYSRDETEPFAEDAGLLTIRVAPELGADCMLMTLDGHSMFIDLGVAKNYPMIRQLIDLAGIDQVEYVFSTHPHTDHLGGFQPLLESGFEVGALITFFPHDYSGESVIQRKAIRAAEEYGVPVLDMQSEDRIPFGDAELTAYRIPGEKIRKGMSCNDLSTMLLVRYGGCSILLGADVEAECEGILTNQYELKADILKYPHHGLSKANLEFLREVDPQYVIFTHGTINTKHAQKQLKQNGYFRMMFATWGVITLQTDGEKWIVSQEINPETADYAQRYLKENPWIRQ